MNTVVTRLALLLPLCVLAAGDWSAQAQNPPAPQPLNAERIRDDLYVIVGDGGNATALLTVEGVILVDTKNERNYDDLVANVKALTDKPIKYVINTHPHADHVGGNQRLAATADIVGHVNLRAAMMRTKLAGPPPLTYTDQMKMFLGGKEVQLRHFGPCHTDGDTFVYFPAHKVLATGDCFNTGKWPRPESDRVEYSRVLRRLHDRREPRQLFERGRCGPESGLGHRNSRTRAAH